MKIKYKIALYYTLSAAFLLIAFATLAYYFSAQSRRAEYLDRLEYRARSIGSVIIENDQVQIGLLRKLDKTTFQDLYRETILVYNERYDLLYANVKDTAVRTQKFLLDYIKEHGQYIHTDEEGETVGVYYTEDNVSVLVLVSSFDKYGFQNLLNLRQIIGIELLVAVVLLVGIGYFFARKMMQPIDRLVEQANSINANNLQDKRVAIKGKDEIAQLGANFNTMLQRLSHSFDLQKSFVSNASHELRTPLAAIISQLQVTLAKGRSGEEYEAVLHSVLEDAEGLSELTNGLLQLAQSELNRKEFVFTPVRIDELLIDTADLVRLKRKENSKVELQFMKEPDQDTLVTCSGNESLLKVLFINLFDNACKFSEDHTARVTIDFNSRYILISVKDNGIGIAADEQDKIFEPFFRGRNAQATRGHGLGLSICKKIVQLHEGQLTVMSDPTHGTVFTVQFPHL
ncbi:HAMP domain-containing protein [Chitinophaga sp. SYP-B3965]|uniref:sensor histidine kinase n=1 Tax=Chitinophaga sp. SYP-B3965 TaxID=2663120 RepID=UPI001299BC98|nr:HAMP domain-containing sensor histidine kinase [Chitinophaga sp. SYP-B3965]MRG44411.1 HAMP domain-containing protein [Chitinophaga sp. SYP-B3965]